MPASPRKAPARVAGWLRSSFAPSTQSPERDGGHWSRMALLSFGAVVVGTALALLRQGGVPATDTLWAEDGSFLEDALDRSFSQVLLAPMHGYALVVPRLLAEIASHLPLSHAAAVLSGGSAVVTACLALFVYHASGSILRRRWLRAVLASSMILLPAAALESLNNAANLHWFFIYAAFWALVWVPTTWMGRWSAIVVILLAALSDPLTLLLAPVLAARVVAVRGWSNHLPGAAWVIGLAIQLSVVEGGRVSAASSPDIPGILTDLGARVIAFNLLGTEITKRLWEPWHGPLPVLAIALFVALVTYAMRRPELPTKAVIALATLVGISLLIVTHYLRLPGFELGSVLINLGGSRYAVVPGLFLLSVLICLLDRPDPRIDPRAWSALTAGVALCLALSWSSSFVVFGARGAGPTWQQSLATARSACAALAAPASVIVPITPGGWVTQLSCGHVIEQVPRRPL